VSPPYYSYSTFVLRISITGGKRGHAEREENGRKGEEESRRLAL
jgi:hypothetical protein